MTEAVRNAQSQAWKTILPVHGAVFGQLSRELSQEFGITPAKYDALAQLNCFPEGLNQRDLSRHLKVTDGLISREEAAGDRRALLVQITGPGRLFYLAARAQHNELLGGPFASVDNERLTDTHTTLEQLSRALDQNQGRETE